MQLLWLIFFVGLWWMACLQLFKLVERASTSFQAKLMIIIQLCLCLFGTSYYFNCQWWLGWSNVTFRAAFWFERKDIYAFYFHFVPMGYAFRCQWHCEATKNKLLHCCKNKRNEYRINLIQSNLLDQTTIMS